MEVAAEIPLTQTTRIRARLTRGPTWLPNLELGTHLTPVGAVAGEQLVQKSLCLSFLTTVIATPLGHKFGEGRLNLETATHGQISRTESPA